LHTKHKVSLRQACILLNISSSVYYYKPILKDDNPIISLLTRLADEHSRWGFWMMYHHLRNMGHIWNHKRVYRVYLALDMNIRRKHKKRLPARVQEPLVLPIGPNITWSMDFMHDTLMNGRKIRTLNIIDDYNREVLNITIDTSLNSKRVIRELEQLVSWRGIPDRIRVDNGPEFISERLSEWCNHPERNIDLKFIQKGKPSQNGYIERFNRSYREEVLSAYLFESIEDVRDITNQWIWEYNNIRPHDSLMNLPPTKFLLKYGKIKDFPTFQQDINIKRKYLNLTAAN
jgi:putative transposase